MKKADIQRKRIPDKPGIYFFLGVRKEILYIGRATSLSSRIRSYFSENIKEKRSELIAEMVNKAKTVEWTVTDSVLEAMLLEVNLIRTHKPKYNTISKDDKSYNHLVITNEEFPRVLIVRAKDLTERFSKKEVKYVYGPFPNGTLFKGALKIIRRLFQFYDTKKPVKNIRSRFERGKIDFNRQIGLFPSVQSKKEYARTIRHLRFFFEGKKEQIIQELENEMSAHAEKEAFEKADELKKKIFALKHIQDIALINDDSRLYRDTQRMRIEGYDISHLSGKDMVGAMTVIEGGVPDKSAYRRFKIASVHASNDTGALREVFGRRLQHTEWPLPQLIAVDGSTAQKRVVERLLAKNHLSIPVVGVVKDERHKPKRILGPKKLVSEHENGILLANAEAHRFAIAFHSARRRRHLPT
jgi:excinuclease ABC subunit C